MVEYKILQNLRFLIAHRVVSNKIWMAAQYKIIQSSITQRITTSAAATDSTSTRRRISKTGAMIRDIFKELR